MNGVEKFLREIAFTIKRRKELELNRRGFIASSLSLMGIMFLSVTPLAAVANKIKEDNDDAEKFVIGHDQLKVGDSFTFAYPDENDGAIIVRLSEKEYRAYNNKCTHLTCPVYWEKDTGLLTCPCHNGFFKVEDGSVLAGPPPRPLPSIKLKMKDDGIYAVGIEQLMHT